MIENMKFQEKLALELLEKRKREIENFQKEVKNLSSELYKPFAEKQIIPWKKNVLKDPYYSDYIWKEMEVKYTIIFPPFVFDYSSPGTFIVKGCGGEIKILGKKTQSWNGEWSDPLYHIDVTLSEKAEIKYPPKLIGKNEIIKDINSTLLLLGLQKNLGKEVYEKLEAAAGEGYENK